MFSNDDLQQLIAGRIISDQFPYDTRDEKEVSAHINRLFHRICRIPNVVCEAEWNHFGSGYASFVEFFCYRNEDVSVIQEKATIREEKREGLIIDICRLAPAAILGGDVRYRTIDRRTGEEISGAYGSLLDGPERLNVPEKLQPLASQLVQALKEFGYEEMEAEKLGELLPFQGRIPTLYRKPKDYLILDAFFYWED